MKFYLFFSHVLHSLPIKAAFLAFMLISCSLIHTQEARLIIFSYDRPLQLYALLESVKTYVSGIESIHVIYRASNDRFEHAYAQVAQSFPEVQYVKQNAADHTHFKTITERALTTDAPHHVLFAVDDIIVTDHIDLAQDIALLEQTGAYGFYFRLGTNLNYCYTVNRPQPVPTLKTVHADVLSWQLNQGTHDWGYPNTVDMTLYRTSDVINALNQCTYRSPNQLEAAWANQFRSVHTRQGLCYRHSKMVNIPCNRVQRDFQNLYNTSQGTDVDAHALLNLFEQGYKIDIALFFKIHNTAAHQEYSFRNIPR